MQIVIDQRTVNDTSTLVILGSEALFYPQLEVSTQTAWMPALARSTCVEELVQRGCFVAAVMHRGVLQRHGRPGAPAA